MEAHVLWYGVLVVQTTPADKFDSEVFPHMRKAGVFVHGDDSTVATETVLLSPLLACFLVLIVDGDPLDATDLVEAVQEITFSELRLLWRNDHHY